MHSLPVSYSCLFSIPYVESSSPAMQWQLQEGCGGLPLYYLHSTGRGKGMRSSRLASVAH